MRLKDYESLGWNLHDQGGLYKNNYRLFTNWEGRVSIYNTLDCRIDKTANLLYHGKIKNKTELKELIEEYEGSNKGS